MCVYLYAYIYIYIHILDSERNQLIPQRHRLGANQRCSCERPFQHIVFENKFTSMMCVRNGKVHVETVGVKTMAVIRRRQ